MKRNALNLRDLGGIPLQDSKGKTPRGLYLSRTLPVVWSRPTSSTPVRT